MGIVFNLPPRDAALVQLLTAFDQSRTRRRASHAGGPANLLACDDVKRTADMVGAGVNWRPTILRSGTWPG